MTSLSHTEELLLKRARGIMRESYNNSLMMKWPDNTPVSYARKVNRRERVARLKARGLHPSGRRISHNAMH